MRQVTTKTAPRTLTRFGTKGFLTAMIAIQIASAPQLFASELLKTKSDTNAKKKARPF